MQTVSLALKNFNERVKQMNQTNSKQLVLPADEARNLHSDIFTILANITELVATMQQISTNQPKNSNIMNLDGGNF
jgi:hypothetical protein